MHLLHHPSELGDIEGGDRRHLADLIELVAVVRL